MAGAETTLNLVIGVVDNASGPLKGISGGLEKTGSSALGVGKIIGGLAFGGAIAGVGALSAALVTGIGDARDAALVMAQTEQVIKSTGGAAGFTAQQIAEMAGSLSAASGKSLFGDDDIQRGQNMLLTFTNIKETLPDTTKIMLDMAQALGTDAGGAAVQLGKALNDPINGISALSRVGVSFTEQQKEQIATMQAAGDMAGAQRVILAELNKEFGGSAEAAAIADGGWAQFQDRMGELGEAIGAKVLPLLNQLLAWLNSPEIQAAIEQIGTNLVAAVTAAGAAFGSFLTLMQPVVDFVSANLTPILAGLATVLLAVVIPAFIAWATAAAAAALATITALAPVLLPIAAIGVAVGLLVAAWDRDWGGIRTTLTTFWEQTGKPIFEAFKTWLIDTLTKAIADFQIGWSIAWPIIQEAVRVVYDFLTGTVWPWFQTALTNLATWINTAQASWSTAWGLISGAVTTAKNTISGVIATIKGLVQGAIDRINDLIALINSIPGIPDVPTLPGGTEGKALGGPVRGGVPYIVGERGPELFVPRLSGTIVPNGVGGTQIIFEPGSIVQSPGEDAAALATRVASEIDRRNRLARTR